MSVKVSTAPALRPPVPVGVDLHQVVEAALMHVLDPDSLRATTPSTHSRRRGRSRWHGTPYRNCPMSLGSRPKMREASGLKGHPAVPVDHDQAGADGVLDVAEGGVEGECQ
jgi:hypothetical protein